MVTHAIKFWSMESFEVLFEHGGSVVDMAVLISDLHPWYVEFKSDAKVDPDLIRFVSKLNPRFLANPSDLWYELSYMDSNRVKNNNMKECASMLWELYGEKLPLVRGVELEQVGDIDSWDDTVYIVPRTKS